MKFKKSYVYLHFLIINPLLNILPFFWIVVSYDNQSYIGNQLGHTIYLVLWAISSALGFYFYSKHIWNKYRIYYHKHLHKIICLAMCISCIIPYSDTLAFWINDLHVWIAVAAVFLFILEWIRAYFDPACYVDTSLQKHLQYLFLLFSICTLVLFGLGHVTSLSEILFSTLINLYLGIWYVKNA